MVNFLQQNIVNLQKRKRNLAKFTLDLNGGDKTGEGLSGSLDVSLPFLFHSSHRKREKNKQFWIMPERNH